MWWLLAPATTSHLLLKCSYLCLVVRLSLTELLLHFLLHLLQYLKHFLILLRSWGWQLIVNIHSIDISFSRFHSQFLAIPASCRCRHLSFSWWHIAYNGRSVTTRHRSIIWSIRVFGSVYSVRCTWSVVFGSIYSIWIRSARHGSIIWFSLRGQVCERLPRQLFKLFDVRR